MRLKVLLPDRVLVDEDARRVSFEAADGSMVALPRMQDLATALVPGVMVFEPAAGGEQFVGVAEGVVVKRGDELLVSTRKGIRGPKLGELRRRIEEEFLRRDEREEEARVALGKIEATFVHRFIELDHG